MAHGLSDRVVSISLHKSGYKLLEKKGCNVIWKEYDMDHTTCKKQINDLNYFFSKI